MALVRGFPQHASEFAVSEEMQRCELCRQLLFLPSLLHLDTPGCSQGTTRISAESFGFKRESDACFR